MSYSLISLNVEDRVGILTLNSPENLNAISIATLHELRDALERVQSDPEIRVLLLTGAGRAFSSGANLGAGDFVAGEVDAGEGLELYFNPLVEMLFALPKPVITAVNGAAAGAGCGLALAGDYVVAAESAYFLQAFINIGLIPDAGSTWLLPRCVGRARALEMMMLGERIGAQKALEWGMIAKVVPGEQLLEEALKVARKLANGPTVAYGLLRQAVQGAMVSTLPEALAMERRFQKIAGETADFVEGVAAFAERRPAQFRGA